MIRRRSSTTYNITQSICDQFLGDMYDVKEATLISIDNGTFYSVCAVADGSKYSIGEGAGRCAGSTWPSSNSTCPIC